MVIQIFVRSYLPVSLGSSHMKRRTAYIHHFKFGAKVCLKKIVQLCFYQLAGYAVDFVQFQVKSTSRKPERKCFDCKPVATKMGS